MVKSALPAITALTEPTPDDVAMADLQAFLLVEARILGDEGALKVSVAAGSARMTSISCALPAVGPSPTASPRASRGERVAAI